MQPVTATVAARVAEGALVLDTHLPGWAARIDPDRLNARSFTNSVLRQLRGQSVSVSRLCAVLRVNQPAHGFALDNDATCHQDGDIDPDTVRRFKELTAAWQAEITRRTSSIPAPVTAEGVG